MTSGTAAFTKVSNAPIPKVHAAILRIVGPRRVDRWMVTTRSKSMARGYRFLRTNLEAVSAGPWLSCLCPFQVQWPAQSPVLRRSASGDLGIVHRNPRLLACTSETMQNLQFGGVIDRFAPSELCDLGYKSRTASPACP